MPLYNYTVSGVGAGGHTWSVSGQLRAANAGAFFDLPELAMREAFTALTQGKAVYGTPGVGCRGPYKVTKLVIEEDTGVELDHRVPQGFRIYGG